MTPAASRRKGAKAETDMLSWLLGKDYQAVRQHLAGAADEGDLLVFRNGVAVDVIEVKSAARYEFPAWLRELDVEVANVKARRPGVKVRGWLVVRPKGTPNPAKWLVVRRCEEVW